VANLTGAVPEEQSKVAVVGCGNPNRCDDGVAGEVLRLLSVRDIDSTRIKLLDAGTNGMAVMFAARGSRQLIIIDACHSGAEPGSVFEVLGDELAAPAGPPVATHEFRWNHAIAAGRQIFRRDFPVDIITFLIEAASLDYGISLSPCVAAAAVTVAGRIAARISETLPAEHAA
jgi:hydrogenase maturation protease